MPLPGMDPYTKFDEEHVEPFLSAICIGAKEEDAADVADISVRTVQNWNKQGRLEYEKGVTEEDSKYVEFYLRYRSAKVKRKMVLLQLINTAAQDPKNWKAAQTLLMIMDSDYSPKRRLEVESTETHRIHINQIEVSRPSRLLEKKDYVDVDVVEKADE